MCSEAKRLANRENGRKGGMVEGRVLLVIELDCRSVLRIAGPFDNVNSDRATETF
jgi:hypothetical protein